MNTHELEHVQLTGEDGEWILVLERILEHPREEVWAALTGSEQIPSWGPFQPDRDLTSTGAVRLKHIDMPEADEVHGYVLEVDAPHLLVYRWGTDILRWELNEVGDKTTLVLRHRFADRKQAPSYAAGWHLCLKGLAGILAGKQMPSMVGHNAMKYGWNELYKRYAEQLGVTL
ncbi:SRPBCC family protein [Fodinisporobacter ferrooxydans]|uniref:SRPBCC family protein n=1 Tax=Fodinisporobacter ferrooxydans TaxID=2901836 RepID=A0ABY4CJB5_9BACL|nr:SRPBCC family protein [Alicyclobacillaceae bacterium MYW30-H2]